MHYINNLVTYIQYTMFKSLALWDVSVILKVWFLDLLYLLLWAWALTAKLL